MRCGSMRALAGKLETAFISLQRACGELELRYVIGGATIEALRLVSPQILGP